MTLRKTLTSLVIAGASLFANPQRAKPETLFFDNFEQENAQGWVSQGGNWNLVNDSLGNGVFRQNGFVGGGNNFTFATTDFFVDNYNANVDINILERRPNDVGAGFKIYRENQFGLHEGIALNLFPRSSYLSVSALNQNNQRIEYIYSMSIETNRWYHLGLNVSNGLFDVLLDGNVVMNDLPTISHSGYFSLDTDDMIADFDNVTLYRIPEPFTLALLGIGALALGKKRSDLPMKEV